MLFNIACANVDFMMNAKYFYVFCIIRIALEKKRMMTFNVKRMAKYLVHIVVIENLPPLLDKI